MAHRSIAITVVMGLIAGIAFFVLLASLHPTPPWNSKMSIYEATQESLFRGVAIGKATIDVRKVSEFGIPTGPPICLNKLQQSDVNSSRLGSILANTTHRQETYRLSPAQFLPIAKTLCVTSSWLYYSKDQSPQAFPGWISLGNNNSKYWYSLNVYWNITEKNMYKPVGPSYHGPTPKYDRVKVYIFPNNQEFFDDDLFADFQRAGIALPVVNLMPFGATSAGIVNTGAPPSGSGLVDTNNQTLVVPGGADFYIDKDVKKPDGTPLTIKDLSPNTALSENFSQGSFPVRYDYDYVQIPAIWFIVSKGSDSALLDSHINQIKNLINTEMSQCLQYKHDHPDQLGRPCLN